MVRRGLLAFVMASALVLVFHPAEWLVAGAAGALTLYLLLGWRQFSVATWVPVSLSLAALVAALWQGIPWPVLLDAMGRMVFLGALIAVLGTLRAAAALAREVALAGAFLTGQPAARRYLALNFGGHAFGVLINFGGLAVLLDIARRSLDTAEARSLPPGIREIKLRRMTMAIIRGFALIALWSPMGFATNVILITLPDISYAQFGPLGFAMSFVFVLVGWAFDAVEGRRYRGTPVPRIAPPPEPGAARWF